jgi:hypothetical protein
MKTEKVSNLKKIYDWIQRHKDVLSILILIAGIIGTIGAAYLGASAQVDLAQKNNVMKEKEELKNIATMVYLDIRLQEYSLRRSNETLSALKNIMHVNGVFYPDNGLYYSIRPQIARLKPSVAKNVTVFYTDMMWAEIFRKETNSALDQNRDASYAYQQEVWAIQNAWYEEPLLAKELETEYNISLDLSTRYQ